MRLHRIISLPLMIVFGLSLSHGLAEERSGGVQTGQWNDGIELEYESHGKRASAALRIYFPKTSPGAGYRRVLIALHEYGRTNREWSDYTDIEQFADEFGFVIVCPNMGQTAYETKFYPETVRPWDGVPGGTWVGEILVPFLKKKYRLARDREATGILGISSGARGALLIACRYPGIFGAAAGISGFYDTSVLTDNRIISAVYGRRTLFKDRWENDDNIIELASRLRNTRVFLAHAARDREIPVEQSQLLGMRLRQLEKKSKDHYKFEYQESESYHPQDWRRSRALIGDVMRFFDKNLER